MIRQVSLAITGPSATPAANMVARAQLRRSTSFIARPAPIAATADLMNNGNKKRASALSSGADRPQTERQQVDVSSLSVREVSDVSVCGMSDVVIHTAYSNVTETGNLGS